MTSANVAKTPAAAFPEAAATISKLDLADLEGRVRLFRQTMLIGLAAFGEIERLSDLLERYKMCNISLPPDLRVLHPTGSADTVGVFSEGLRCLDLLVSDVTGIADRARNMRPQLVASTVPGKTDSPRVPEKNLELEEFGGEVCRRVSAVQAILLGALELMRKNNHDQGHRELFSGCEIIETAADLLYELTGDAVDAEHTMAKLHAKSARGAV